MSKTQKRKRRYTSEFKELVLKRLEPPTSDTVTSLSEELGVTRGTIYAWLRAKDNNPYTPKSTKRWTSEDKFHIVLETSTLTEEELAAYCRRKGLLVEDVKAWREQCLRANATKSKDPQKLEQDLKDEKEKTKNLEKELSRKEKALAETAALLVLRKKAQAIWGDPEED
ncbi:MAG: transposase [Anaerovoracaceae bacterium]